MLNRMHSEHAPWADRPSTCASRSRWFDSVGSVMMGEGKVTYARTDSMTILAREEKKRREETNKYDKKMGRTRGTINSNVHHYDRPEAPHQRVAFSKSIESGFPSDGTWRVIL